MKIAIIYSLPTRRALASPFLATDEDTKESADEVAEALVLKGVTVVLLPISEDTIDQIRNIRADVIFNLLEWDGLDGSLLVRAMEALDATGIAYTGSSNAALAVCNDKSRMKAAMEAAGLPTPRWQKFETGNESVRDDFVYPAIVKLGLQHCSVGLTKDAVVKNADELIRVTNDRMQTFKQSVYVEEFIVGREFQVTIIQKKNGLAVLHPAEILFTTQGTGAFLTYGSRWDETHADYKESSVRLAHLSLSFLEKINRISHKAFIDMGFADYSRLDIRTRDDEVFILEANANPGLGDSDDYGMTVSYKAAGMTFADFIREIVESCLRRSTSVR
ncbi:MAG: hypothetical protein Q8L37_05955 [Candidatus Gottesmanbacteria bacterium]|nr:hypothetical protein [Candidatus Gottesmanbacteria bacterium]